MPLGARRTHSNGEQEKLGGARATWPQVAALFYGSVQLEAAQPHQESH